MAKKWKDIRRGSPERYEEMKKEAMPEIACKRGHLKSVCDDGNGDCIECSLVELGRDAIKECEALGHNQKIHKAHIRAAEQSNNTLTLRVKELVCAFKHTHIALYKDGNLTDECDKCGLDIRDTIHSAEANKK